MLENIIKPYTLAGLIGVILAAVVFIIIDKKRSYIVCKWACFFSALIGMFIGAHLLYFIVGLPDFISSFSERVYSFQSLLSEIAISSSGMVFYGGLFGAMLGIVIFCRRLRLPLRPYLNIGCCIFPLVHAFGRIGCTLTGCCYGIEYHGIFAIQYTEEVVVQGINDHITDFPRFPVQILECILELMIFAALLIIYFKTENKYSLAAIYLVVYGVIRFADEYLRGDSVRGLWGPFSTSQWIALISILCVVIWKRRSSYSTV